MVLVRAAVSVAVLRQLRSLVRFRTSKVRGHFHTFSRGDMFTSFSNGHRHKVLKSRGVTGPAQKNKHVHKLRR